MRPAAAAPPPRTVAGGSGFLELDELAFEQTSSTDMVVRDAGSDIIGHVNRRPRLEEPGFLIPRVMVLETTGPDGPVDLLHITDPRSMGGADCDAALPDGTPVAHITEIWRWFRLNLAIHVEAGEGPPVASISRESMGFCAYFLSRYRYRLRIEPGVDRPPGWRWRRRCTRCRRTGTRTRRTNEPGGRFGCGIVSGVERWRP
ncbi:hypothetical protein BJP08_08595 [Corynebacterium sp. NML140438]|nr:hypothetical protein BJP08_08595 [Corynebacterium sp. NML140438]